MVGHVRCGFDGRVSARVAVFPTLARLGGVVSTQAAGSRHEAMGKWWGTLRDRPFIALINRRLPMGTLGQADR
jgi:hypothetical protein